MAHRLTGSIVSSSPTPTPDIALDFKSATLYALRVVLHTHDTSTLLAALTRRMTEAGAFYEHEPIVIDAQALTQSPDWAMLLDTLRIHHLHPIGVTAQGAVLADAQAHGLAAVDISAAPVRKAPAPSQDIPPPLPTAATSAAVSTATPPSAVSPPEPAAEPSPAPAAMVIRHPLRSGQRIYAKGTDLIVIGMVSQGAEVIADGNIHIYGPLRGKAMAGARGDTQAMILTTQMDPELLAIAGVYRVVETALPDNVHNQPAQVLLDGGTLKIRPLQRHASNL
ncbi:septum site-determining protein MinC [Alcaligenaceae bacterium CGII-47]|nr:septum site-determining protein MinC [Alcaligenaceae bacterium CGII-47]